MRAEPIKGTRRRLADPVEDAALKHELATSPKDRAENIMIVDLLRNDLSHLAVPGTVTVINGTELRVTTSITYDPVFLSIIGVGTQTSAGEAEVRLAQVLNGEVAP